MLLAQIATAAGRKSGGGQGQGQGPKGGGGSGAPQATAAAAVAVAAVAVAPPPALSKTGKKVAALALTQGCVRASVRACVVL